MDDDTLIERLKSLVKETTKEFEEKEKKLFEIRGQGGLKAFDELHELTFAARFFVALDYKFKEMVGQTDYKDYKEYSVDAEYNVEGGANRTLADPKKNNWNKRKRPDIIIHNRGVVDDNLLVIEIKMGGNSNTDDIVKLEMFTDPNGKFKYKLGASIILKAGKSDIQFFP